MKRLLSVTVAALMALGLDSCATQSPPPTHPSPSPPPLPLQLIEASAVPWKPKNDSNNAYYKFVWSQPQAFGEKLNSTPLDLFRIAYAVFTESLLDRIANDGLLRSFPSLVIHGDFHPLHFRIAAGIPQIDRFDNADEGPWWWDVIRMESAGLLIANAQSLTSYREGACIDGYKDQIRSFHAKVGSVPAPNPGLPVYLPHEREEKLVLPPDGIKIPKDYAAAFAMALGAGKSIRAGTKIPAETEFKEIERYLVLTSDNTLVEFKEEVPRPLQALAKRSFAADFATIPRAEAWKNGCERHNEAWKLYRKSEPSGCAQVGAKSFALIPWTATYAFPTEKDFTSPQALEAHLRWMCMELARVHGQQMDADSLRELQLALAWNRALLERIKAYARQEFENVMNGYRTWLGAKPNLRPKVEAGL